MARARWDGAGGITGLVELIERHGEALEADLQREYQVDLADVFTGRLSFRRLNVLIKGLPGDGTAMWRAGRRNMAKDVKGSPPPDEFWTAERDLLASIVDVLNVLAWQPTKDAQKGQNAPKPIRRPGVDDGTKRYGTATTAVRVLQLLRPGRGGGEPVDPHAQPEAPENP